MGAEQKFYLSRRGIVAALGFGTALAAVPRLARADFPKSSDINGELPSLAFHMTRSSDGKTVTASDYRGKVVVLYFGFTRCPDICPLTMHNMAEILGRMGPFAARMRVLFVTIDLAYDTLPRLKTYLASFGPPPDIDGLRGTEAELATLAKRYYVEYHAPANPDAPDPVSKISHGSAVYVFDPKGRSRYLLSGLAAASVDIPAMEEGFDRLARTARA